MKKLKSKVLMFLITVIGKIHLSVAEMHVDLICKFYELNKKELSREKTKIYQIK
jgi:hypothetical protein